MAMKTEAVITPLFTRITSAIPHPNCSDEQIW